MEDLLQTYFQFDERLEMWVPDFADDWETLPDDVKLRVSAQWGKIRGRIPELIKAKEVQILDWIEDMYKDISFAEFCRLNDCMTDMAAEINELNIWMRYEPQFSVKGGSASGGDGERAHF